MTQIPNECVYIKTLFARRLMSRFSKGKVAQLTSLYASFLKSVWKMIIHRTILCKNIIFLAEDCNWKIQLICESLDIRSNIISLDNFYY